MLVLLLGVTYPLCLDFSKYLIFPPEFHKTRVHWADPEIHVRYLTDIRDAVLEKENPIAILRRDPNFAISPSYAALGALLSLVMPPVAAHNVVFLIFEVLAGVAMFLLARRLTGDYWAALYAGALFCTNNYILMQHMGGRGHAVQMAWIPLSFLFLERVLSQRALHDALILGLVLTLTLLAAGQYVLHLTVLLPLYVLLRSPRTALERRTTGLLGIAAAAFLLTSFPYLWLLRLAPPKIYSLAVNMRPAFRLDSPAEFFQPSSRLFLGLVPPLLAILAVAMNLKHPPARSLAVVTLVSVVLMIGPFAVWAPYRLLYDYWPGFAYLRTPVRLQTVTLMGVAALSAMAVAQLRSNVPRRWQNAVIVLVFLVTWITQVRPSPFVAGGEIKETSGRGEINLSR
jgi:hypothetical protein